MDPTASGYTLRDAARLLDLSVSQIQSLLRAGLIVPERGRRGEFRLSFQDLVVLRSAATLLDHVPPRRLRKALARLREQMPDGGLHGIRLSAEGRGLIAHDGHQSWDPESGQGSFDFSGDRHPQDGESPRPILPLGRRGALPGPLLEPDAEDWHMRGCDLEGADPDAARAAYMRAIELDPDHADALINLGRLLHEAGDLAGAEARYRRALEVSEGDATAAFNLGVVLEDLHKPLAAITAYKLAIAADPSHADAHYNLSHLYETLGHRRNALRHLDIYRKLVRGA
jgi:tetratricopeptide (TPR) repeat protein